MLDLSFELGLPAHLLAQVLPEREYQRYLAYAKTRGLPSRRVELMLAQLTAIVVNAAYRDSKATAEDFLLDPEPDTQPTSAKRQQAASAQNIAALKEQFGFSPINTD